MNRRGGGLPRKRLTAPELAAEYWSAEKTLGDARSIGRGFLGIEQILHERVLTLHRFAELPHYDEEE